MVVVVLLLLLLFDCAFLNDAVFMTDSDSGQTAISVICTIHLPIFGLGRSVRP